MGKCSWCGLPNLDKETDGGICHECMEAMNGSLKKKYGDDLECDEGAGIYSKTSYEFDERR